MTTVISSAVICRSKISSSYLKARVTQCCTCLFFTILQSFERYSGSFFQRCHRTVVLQHSHFKRTKSCLEPTHCCFDRLRLLILRLYLPLWLAIAISYIPEKASQNTVHQENVSRIVHDVQTHYHC